MHYRIKCITELKGEHEIHNTKMLKLFKDKIKENKIKGDFLSKIPSECLYWTIPTFESFQFT